MVSSLAWVPVFHRGKGRFILLVDFFAPAGHMFFQEVNRGALLIMWSLMTTFLLRQSEASWSWGLSRSVTSRPSCTRMWSWRLRSSPTLLHVSAGPKTTPPSTETTPSSPGRSTRPGQTTWTIINSNQFGDWIYWLGLFVIVLKQNNRSTGFTSTLAWYAMHHVSHSLGNWPSLVPAGC